MFFLHLCPSEPFNTNLRDLRSLDTYSHHRIALSAIHE